MPRARDDLRDPRLAWVAGVAAGVRLIWVLAMSRPPGGLSDPLLYQRFAQGIARGQGYVSFSETATSYYPPGYPFFLGAVQWVADRFGISGQMPLLAGILQALLGGVAAGAIFVVGRRLVGARVGLAAGLIFGLWPNLVVYSSVLLSEPLFLACFAVMLAALVTMRDEGGGLVRARVVTAALATGAATMVRPQVLVVVPAFALAWLISGIGWRTTLRCLAVPIVGVIVFVTPWAIRNAVVLDGFVPVSTNGGDNLCVGFNPEAEGRFSVPEYCDTGEFYIDGPAAELRHNRTTRARATRWATGHIGELFGLSLDKLRYTYRDDIDGLRSYEAYDQDLVFSSGTRSALRAFANISYAFIMAAAGAGVVLVGIRGARSGRGSRDEPGDPTPWAILGATLTSAMVPVLVFGDGRFKVPSTPLFAVLAGVAFVALLDRVRPRTGATDDQPADLLDPVEQPTL